MKKKQNNKAEKWLIGVAIALLAVCFAGVLFLALNAAGAFDSFGRPEETSAPETTDTPETVLHNDVETFVNEDGTPKRVVYYKDNVYNGSIDYVYDGASVYEVHFDADDNLVKSIKKTINEVGSVVYESYTEKEKMVKEIEYTYYDDYTTVWKKLTTDHSGKSEIATKEIFSEKGLLTDKYVYEDSVEVSHVVYTYDENGEIVSEEEMAK